MSMLIPSSADRRTKASNHLGRYTPEETVDTRAVLDAIETAADHHDYHVEIWPAGEPGDESKSPEYHHNAADAEYILQRSDFSGGDDDGWVYGNPEILTAVEGYKVRTIEKLSLLQEGVEDPSFIDFYVPEGDYQAEEEKELAVRYDSGRRWLVLSKDGEEQAQELVDTVMEELSG